MEDLKPDTESWNLACNEVRHALEEYGCFMVIYEGFSQELKREIFDALKTLFDLPTQTKMTNTSDKPFHGYVGPFPSRPLYESMGIDHPTSFHAVQTFAELMWPSGNDYFSKIMHTYAKLVSEVENRVMKMVFKSYGVEKNYESHRESMVYLLNLVKYRAPKSDETNVGAKVHTDKSFLTILSQNQVDGLQIQTKDGKWIRVNYLPSSFVVQGTDSLMAWSNGRLKSPRHRVIIEGQEDRYSLAFFAYKKGIIEIPEELIDDDHPKRFNSFDNFKFLDFYAKNPIYRDDCAIKLFCGVENTNEQ